MIDLEKRIEANANLVLWCTHVLGSDDVYAAPSYSAACAHARALNLVTHELVDADADVLCFAYAAPWPHSAEDHAENLKRWRHVWFEDEETGK